jgi:hypothetical protein
VINSTNLLCTSQNFFTCMNSRKSYSKNCFLFTGCGTKAWAELSIMNLLFLFVFLFLRKNYNKKLFLLLKKAKVCRFAKKILILAIRKNFNDQTFFEYGC